MSVKWEIDGSGRGVLVSGEAEVALVRQGTIKTNEFYWQMHLDTTCQGFERTPDKARERAHQAFDGWCTRAGLQQREV